MLHKKIKREAHLQIKRHKKAVYALIQSFANLQLAADIRLQTASKLTLSKWSHFERSMATGN